MVGNHNAVSQQCAKRTRWDKDYTQVKTGSFEATNVIECNLSLNSLWILDSGSSSHICADLRGLSDCRKLAKGEIELRAANGALCAATVAGTYKISLPSGLELVLNDCYLVPSFSKNIISVSKLDGEGYTFSIKGNTMSFFKDDIYYGRGYNNGGLYLLDRGNRVNCIQTKRTKAFDSSNTTLWHNRLGHINDKRIIQLLKGEYLESFEFEPNLRCESCLKGKMTKAPFPAMGERSMDLLGIVHTDVCGPFRVEARGGYLYFATFTDDLSRYGYVYLMKQKSETFDKFKEFKNEVENQLDKKIKVLRSDRGGEYLSQEFHDYLKECGIVSHWTAPGTPQQNGVSERRNRTLLDMVRSMMSQATLATSF